MLPTSDKSPSLRRKALAGALLVLLLYIGLMWRFIRVFSVYGDDAEVAVNSCLPWFPFSRWGEWLTEGWSHYLTSYPDWGSIAANTLKPVANVAFFLEGLLAARVGEWAFLIGAYLAPAITAFAAVYVFRKFTRASDTVCVVLAAGVATSAIWVGSLFGAVDIVNTFSVMFAAIALALLPVGRDRPRPATQVAIFLLLLLAIFSHESVLPLPFICIALLFAFGASRPRLIDLWPYLGAFGVWAVIRVFVFQGSAEIYALDPTMYSPLKVAVYWAISAFLPVDVRGTYLARGLAPTSGAAIQTLIGISVGVLVLLNVAFLILITYDLIVKHDRRRILMLAAFALGTAPRIFTAPSWAGSRFMGLPMITGIILVSAILINRQKLFRVLAAVVLGAQLLYLATGVTELERGYVREATRAHEYAIYAADAIEAADPDRVVVVNDRWGYYGVPEYIEYLSRPEEHIGIVTINHFDGDGAIWTTGSDGEGTVSVERTGDDIVIEVTAEGGSSLKFLGAVDVDYSRPNQGFRYELIDGSEELPRAFRATGPIGDQKTLVIGYDPATDDFMAPRTFE